MWFRRIEIREIEGTIKAMHHYFAVLRGDEVPNFFLSKRVEVEFDEDAPLEELWEIHKEAMGGLGERPQRKPGEEPPRPQSGYRL